MDIDSSCRFHENPDALWERMDLVIPLSGKGGRPRLVMRDVVAGILHA